MELGTLVAFFGMTVSCSDARAFHVASMRMLMTKLSSVTILLQNNLEKPRVITLRHHHLHHQMSECADNYVSTAFSR